MRAFVDCVARFGSARALKSAAIALLMLPALQAWAAVTTVTSSVFPVTPTYVDGVTGILQFTTASGQPAPTGSVTYSVDGGGTSTATLTNGMAYLNLNEFAVGLHTLNTSYSGDSVYQSSTQPALQFTVVDQAFALVSTEGYTSLAGGLVLDVQGLATDSHDNLYASDYAENNVRVLGSRTYDPVLLPLTGTSHPAGLATDAGDNLYIADGGNGNIYKYTPAGVQSTLPITGLGTPSTLALDRARNLLYIADIANTANVRIWRYDLTAGGALTSIVSGLTRFVGMALDPAGTLYYSDGYAGYHHLDAAGNDIPLYYNVSGYATPGYVGGIFVDRKGFVYVTDNGYGVLLRVDTLGHQTRISTDGATNQMADDSSGRIFFSLGPYVNVINPIDGRAADVAGDPNINGNANPSINFTTYSMPQGVTSLATTYAPAVNFISTGGTAPSCSRADRWGTCYTQFELLYTLPGIRVGNVVATYTSGPTLSSVLYGDAIGSAPAFSPGTQTASPTTARAVSGVGMDQLGNYYASDSTTNKVLKTSSGTAAALPFTGLSHPTTIAIDGLAAVYVLDSGHNRVAKLDSANNQTAPVVAGTANSLTAISAFTLDGNAEIYYAGPAGASTSIYLLDHTGATSVIAANLGASLSLAIDPFNDLYLLQQDGSLLRFDSNRVKSTLSPAGTFPNGVGVGVDASGTAYVIQSNSATVTLVHPDSTTATIPVTALLNGVGIALDGRGSILTADLSTNNFIFVDRSHQDFNFGTVPLNTDTTFTAFIENSGDESVVINGVPGNSDFQLATTADACGSAGGSTIAPAALCDLSFTVHPTVSGTLSASGRVTTTAVNLGVDFDIFSATAAAAPVPTLTPSTLTFSSTVGAATSAQQATLTNSGSAALTISSVALTGSNAASFAQTNTCGTSLAVGASCTLAITCTPTAVGTATATLAVNYPSPLAQQSIALSCAATAALVPQAALTAATANFANVTVGMASMAQAFTLTNAGTAALAVTSVTLGGANASSFAIGSNGCGTSVAAGASCTISVVFTPSSVGSASATLMVLDAVGTQTSTLTGAGVAAPAPQAALTPGSADFGSVTMGSTSSGLIFTLANAGNATLSITSASIAGTNGADFTIAANTCGTSLAADSSCTFTDTFTPSVVGSETATLSVVDSVGTQSATLTGTGTAPAPAADFGITAMPATQTIVAGSTAIYTINVDSSSGTFTQPVALTATGLPPGATVSFSAASVTPGAGGATSTMTVQTAALSGANRVNSAGDPLGTPLGAPMLAVLLIVPFGLRKRTVNRLWCAMALIVVAGALQGCGGGFALPQSTVTPPPTQTYMITVTGTSGSTQHSTIVQLSVQGETPEDVT